MTWKQFPQNRPSETDGIPSQNDISLMLACMYFRANSLAAIDYKRTGVSMSVE